MTESNTCPCCGQPMNRYQMLGKTFEECHTPGCDLNHVTLKAGTHAQLTDVQVAAYAESNRRINQLVKVGC
jgi:hypothetical protein